MLVADGVVAEGVGLLDLGALGDLGGPGVLGVLGVGFVGLEGSGVGAGGVVSSVAGVGTGAGAGAGAGACAGAGLDAGVVVSRVLAGAWLWGWADLELVAVGGGVLRPVVVPLGLELGIGFMLELCNFTVFMEHCLTC